ncbi:MAG: uracil-DNA glycosylase family protein [Novosphingobium sp.]
MPETDLAGLLKEVRDCRLCADFLPHGPRPIVQAGREARIVIIGQAPGSKVHASGMPWDDDSGDRLREWTGLSREQFYDPVQVALVPMGLCYPGKGTGGDLPPRPECAPKWHGPLLEQMPHVSLALLVGQYAQAAYWPKHLRASMTEAVRNHDLGPGNLFPLPHPAWRSRMWTAKNPWFEAEVLPVLREKLSAALEA